MCCMLGSGNIWLRYNYLNVWNLRVEKNLVNEKITFKIVQMKSLARGPQTTARGPNAALPHIWTGPLNNARDIFCHFKM